MNKSKLVFLDTETTGVGPTSRLCQVAYKFNGEEVEALFKPPVPIEIESMAIAHITNKMVADKEPFVDSKMKGNLERIFSGDNILVAHNAQFDAEMLKREGVEIKNIIDTFKIVHHLDTEGSLPQHKLQYLRYFYDLEVENATAHDALGDVRVLEKLFDFVFSEMSKKIENEEELLKEMLAISARPVLLKKFNFGKYSGTKVSEVAKNDKSYLSWLLNQKIMSREKGEENDENWIYTLDYYLNPQKSL